MADPSSQEKLVRMAAMLVLKNLADKVRQEGSVKSPKEGYLKIRDSVANLQSILVNNKDVEARVLLRAAGDVAAESIRFMVDVVLSGPNEEGK